VPRTHYNKLVRDMIPDLIRQDGHACAVEPLDDATFRCALRDKLVEEAREAAEAPDEDLAAELADVQEVLDALVEAHGLTPEAVSTMQRQRRAERGGFARRLRLLWTE
jgi:predicted house-cleaning noncanonical NTP pyrophosphatase (MazG superfamily)